MRVRTATILITAMMLISKGLGIVRESVFAAKFGVTADMDAFVMAFSLVEALGVFFITGLTSVYIPEYSRLTAAGDEKACRDFQRSVFFLVFAGSGVMSLLSVWLSQDIAGLLRPDFSQQDLSAIAALIRLMAPAILFSGLLGYFIAVQEAEKQFRYSSAIYIINNLAMILVVWILASSFGIIAAALAAVAGSFAKMALQWPGLKACNFRFKFSFKFFQPAIRNMGLALIPVALSTVALYLDMFIVLSLTAQLPVGSVSIFSYGTKIEAIIVALLVSPLATSIFPSLSSAAVLAKKDEFLMLFDRCFLLINLVMIPAIGLLGVLRVPVITLLFQRGAFTTADTINTAWIVVNLLPAILASSWFLFFSKVFYSLGKVRAQLAATIVFAFLNILLNYFWIPTLGLYGMAVARSVSLWGAVLLMLFVLYKTASGPNTGRLLMSLFRIIPAAAIAALIANYGFEVVSGHLVIRLAFALLSGSAGYLSILLWMKAPEFLLLRGMVKHKLPFSSSK